MEEELVGESSSPRKKMKIGVVQLVGVVLWCPPVVLRRGGGASMVGEKVELLHGLGLEREGEGSEGGREKAGRRLPGVRGSG